MTIFETMESNVQCYAHSFPVVFSEARGSYLYDNHGYEYLDFLAGCGSLNYGHNHPVIKQALLDYITRDGITHSLDMHTEAKAEFLHTFNEVILKPRALEYRLQFPGPTGTNAVEAALKIARKVTGRTNVISFTNGFHGATLGSVSATGNRFHREGAAVPLSLITHMPYCGYLGQDADTLNMMDRMLSDPSSGIDHPAAVIVETVQGEGGLNVAGTRWLKGLESLCRKHGILLLVDDIQAGCGRTGTFFSFESAGIKPDIVTLSKSISGYGLPMALVLIRPELDQWQPGEHNGTFRGNNHAFITATATLNHFWRNDVFIRSLQDKSIILDRRLKKIIQLVGSSVLQQKGRGLFQGLQCLNGETAGVIAKHAFARRLIIETSGNEGQVLKCLFPLTISEAELNDGLDRLESAILEVLRPSAKRPVPESVESIA